MQRTTFNSRTATPEELDAYRRQVAWIPATATKIERDTTDAVAYRWSKDVRGRTGYFLITFVGKRTKLTLNIYSFSEKLIDERVDQFFAGSESWTEYKAAQRARRRQGPDMSQYTVGTILHASTSYSMTFNDYWQIVHVKGQTVTMRKLRQEAVSGDGYSGQEQPIRHQFAEGKWAEELTRRVTSKGVAVDKNKHAHVWDGRPDYYNTLD